MDQNFGKVNETLANLIKEVGFTIIHLFLKITFNEITYTRSFVQLLMISNLFGNV